jgi:N-acetylglucosaminyl-diphospho-decaprenol L-rhamnosyltransferase
MHLAETVPRLSVVIVTWNCGSLLGDCLASLRTHAGALDYELIIVDNASADDTLAVAARVWPQAQVIANPDNRGFAVACNQGMALARGELMFLLNPDTLLTQPDTLRRLCDRLDAHPEIAMAGVRLTFPDGRYQVGDAGHCPSPASVLSHALLLNRVCQPCFPGLMLQWMPPKGPYERVGWVCGGCTMVRRSALARGGPLDESFFMYGEDVEWGCRYTDGGLVVAYLPDIEIVHVQGGTQKHDDADALPPTRWLDGLARLYQRYNRGRHFWAFRSLALGFALRATMYRAAALVGLGGPQARRRGRAMQAYASHIWRLRPTATIDP